MRKYELYRQKLIIPIYGLCYLLLICWINAIIYNRYPPGWDKFNLLFLIGSIILHILLISGLFTFLILYFTKA